MSRHPIAHHQYRYSTNSHSSDWQIESVNSVCAADHVLEASESRWTQAADGKLLKLLLDYIHELHGSINGHPGLDRMGSKRGSRAWHGHTA